MASQQAMAVAAAYGEYMTRSVADVAEDLESYAALLAQWQRVKNLVSRETVPLLWSRHIADSLQVLKLLKDDQTFLDLGSGAGLPAIPLAIARRNIDGSRFLLVESNTRKASFLRAAARHLALPLRVEARRVEEIDSRETIAPDVITSRALAPLARLLTLARPFFGPATRAIFHKGREYVDELAESRAQWRFDVVVVPSDTSADSALLEIRDLHEKSVG